MPGSIASAAPATVLPEGLCRAFAHSREYLVDGNEYRNGESQREKLTETSRKSWKLARRLTPTAMGTLRSFYDARKGAQEAFYFYDPWDESPQFNGYDPTGEETTGRYTVRFDGNWEQSMGIGRGDVQIALVELA